MNKIENGRLTVVTRVIWGILALCAVGFGHPTTSTASRVECGQELLGYAAIGQILEAPAVASNDQVIARTFQRLQALRLPVAAKAAAPKIAGRPGREDYWKAVGVPFEVLKAIVSNEACYETQVNFLMCVAALNAILSFDDKNYAVLPRERAGLEAFFGPSAMPLGNIDVVPMIKVATADAAQKIKLVKALRRAVQNTWIRAYQNTAARIDFDKALEYMRQMYVTPDKESYVTAAAFNHALLEADPHARIEPIAELQASVTDDERDSFVGIGIQVSLEGEQMMVVRVMDGSPALAAGMKAGDVLLAIDGTILTKDNLDTAIERIMGAPDTQVSITVKRGEMVLDIVAKRAPVTVSNVEWKMFAAENGRLGYISLKSFMLENAPEEIAKAIQSLERRGAHGLVLDLRSNGGGALNVAVEIASLFLGPKQLVVVEKAAIGEKGLGKLPTGVDMGHRVKTDKGTGYLTGDPQLTRLPLVVLINSQSASASELLAGALQDHGRAIIVGDRSFGKGSVQRGFSLKELDGPFKGLDVILFQTVARFYQPSGSSNQITGIEPDFKVMTRPDLKPEDVPTMREGDIYPNALPATGKPAEKYGDDKAMKFINDCVERFGKARSHYTNRTQGEMPLDYQMLYAADVLRCWNMYALMP